MQVPGTPYATPPAELEKLAGYAHDIAKSRAEARRLSEGVGVPENFSFSLKNRNVPMPHEPVAIWLVDQWRQIGLQARHEFIESTKWGDRSPAAQRGVRRHAVQLRGRSTSTSTSSSRWVSAAATTAATSTDPGRPLSKQSRALDIEERREVLPRSSGSAPRRGGHTTSTRSSGTASSPHSGKCAAGPSRPATSSTTEARRCVAERNSGRVRVIKYIVKRLLLMIPTLLGVAVLVFFSDARSLPGDIVELRFAGESGLRARRRTSSKERAQARARQAHLAVSSSPGWAGLVRLDFGDVDVDRARRSARDPSALRALAPALAIMATIVAILLGHPARGHRRAPAGHVDRLRGAHHARSPGSPRRRSGSASCSSWGSSSSSSGCRRWSSHAVLGRSRAQNLAQLDLAGAGRRLPVLGGGDAHDALGDARGAARGLHPHRARQGLWEKLILTRHALKNAMLPVLTVIAPRVRLPHRRAGRHRAGVQPERPRHALRGGGRPPRLHADAGARHAGRRSSSSSSTSWSTWLYAWLDPRIRFR